MVDNLNVVRECRKTFRSATFSPPDYAYAVWWQIWRASREHRHECYWVPSHGKKPEWECPVPGLSTATARQLNEAADEAATAAQNADISARGVSASKRALEEAERWACSQLSFLNATSSAFVSDKFAGALDSFLDVGFPENH